MLCCDEGSRDEHVIVSFFSFRQINSDKLIKGRSQLCQTLSVVIPRGSVTHCMIGFIYSFSVLNQWELCMCCVSVAGIPGLPAAFYHFLMDTTGMQSCRVQSEGVKTSLKGLQETVFPACAAECVSCCHGAATCWPLSVMMRLTKCRHESNTIL